MHVRKSNPCKSKPNNNNILSKRVLEILHIGLFGPSTTQSYEGNFYTLVVVDDFSRYTWLKFLKFKDEVFEKFKSLGRSLQNIYGCCITSIQTSLGGNFYKSVQFGDFCDKHGILHNFQSSISPQIDGVVERKIRRLQGMSCIMLYDQSISQKF